MPTYEYRCNKCGEHFDLFQTFAEEPLKKHPGKCGGKVVKVMSPAGIVFSGSGFYKTDNRRSSGARSSSSESKSSASESKSSESKSSGSESKSGSGETKSSESKGSESKSGSGETKKSA